MGRDVEGAHDADVRAVSSPPSGLPVNPREDERAIRARLGIPLDAEKVLVFGETSHWDPNWLYTSEEYYAKRVGPTLDEVVDALEREPRRVFSVECLFFLRLYWERRPEQRDRIRRLVEERRLQLTGTGVTTPDTVLPSTEAILRDYLLGQEWLRENGMTAEPRLAYLPDDFGCSPALPSILEALGFDRTCLTRIDGMHFVGADYRPASSYPLPGSSAELLSRELRTQDFVWRAPDGAEVLCHWNAFTYFQGDMLAHLGIIRWMGMVFGVPWRTGRHVARRIRGLVRQLAPLSRTPYLFCPIGCDFNGPIHDLVALLDRYNRTHYQRTGVWAVNAGMDDHMALVDCHRASLPVLELDPNPYWMGFYASRPGAKRLCNRVSRKLVLGEKLSFLAGRSDDAAREVSRAWDLVAVSNHHDFITGTSPDRVFWQEQEPWLREAEALADQAIARARAELPSAPARPDPEPPAWSFEDGRLTVTTPAYTLVMSEADGGCIVSLVKDGCERLAGPANDLVAYRDTGGLWRMGHEYFGGAFREVARASRAPAKIAVAEVRGVLEVTVTSTLCGRDVVRRLWLHADDPIVRMEIEGSAARRHTVVCRWPTVSTERALTMNVPGGVVRRADRKLYDPTFWPARSFAHLDDPSGFGLAAFLGGPACVGMHAPGALEWVVLRNAPWERAFGFLPVLAHPASGSERGDSRIEYATWITGPGEGRESDLARSVRRALRAAVFPPGEADLDALASSAITSDHQDVLVAAIKAASRGEGTVVRLRSYAGGRVRTTLRVPGRTIREARACDARERDLGPLHVDADGGVQVDLDRAIASVRLI